MKPTVIWCSSEDWFEKKWGPHLAPLSEVCDTPNAKRHTSQKWSLILEGRKHNSQKEINNCVIHTLSGIPFKSALLCGSNIFFKWCWVDFTEEPLGTIMPPCRCVLMVEPLSKHSQGYVIQKRPFFRDHGKKEHDNMIVWQINYNPPERTYMEREYGHEKKIFLFGKEFAGSMLVFGKVTGCSIYPPAHITKSLCGWPSSPHLLQTWWSWKRTRKKKHDIQRRPSLYKYIHIYIYIYVYIMYI